MIFRILVAEALFLAISFSSAIAQDTPPQIVGSYSVDETCPFDQRMDVGPDAIEFTLGGDVLRLTQWDFCLTCAGGKNYDGIEVMAFPKLGLTRNPIFRFNADERYGFVTVLYAGSDPLPAELGHFVQAGSLQRCK